MRVLIVEDEALIAMAHEDAVADAGYDVVGVATDSAEALRLAGEGSPSLALVDVRLGDGPTGAEVALRLLREHDVRSVFITASVESVPPEAKAACVALLPKPVSHDALVNVLRAAERAIADPDPAEDGDGDGDGGAPAD